MNSNIHLESKKFTEYYLLELSIKQIRSFPSNDMTDPNYIRKSFKLIKIMQKRLENIGKRIIKIKEEKISQNIQKTETIKELEYYFEYLCNHYKHEKRLIMHANNSLLRDINLTG